MKKIKILTIALLLGACSSSNIIKPDEQFDLCKLPPGKVMAKDYDHCAFGANDYMLTIVDRDGIVSKVMVTESVYSLEISDIQAIKDSCKRN